MLAYSESSWESLFVALIGSVVGVCAMIAGYFIGNEQDRKLTRIILLPGSPLDRMRRLPLPSGRITYAA